MTGQILEDKVDRREFVRRAGILLAGAAAVLSGCAAPQSTAVVDSESTSAAEATATPVVQQAQATSTPVAQQAQSGSTSSSAASSTTTGVACRSAILNDPYPGHCKHYVDRNGNGYCDLSEPGSGNVTPRVQG